MAVQQVRPLDHFPSGDSQALLELRMTPVELAARYGLSFEEGYDDLDRYVRAAISLPDHTQAWLVKYQGERDAGTTVYVDDAADLLHAKSMLLRALALEEQDVRWVQPGLVAAASSS